MRRFLPCPVLPFPVPLSPVRRCPVLRFPVLRCPVLRCPVLRCPVLRCPVLRCPAPRYPVLRCRVPPFRVLLFRVLLFLVLLFLVQAFRVLLALAPLRARRVTTTAPAVGICEARRAIQASHRRCTKWARRPCGRRLFLLMLPPVASPCRKGSPRWVCKAQASRQGGTCPASSRSSPRARRQRQAADRHTRVGRQRR